jgi:ABC-2 type transport system permease protein
MVLLFNGTQSSLAMVYDREMGMMRVLLTAPLPRWYLLLCKLAAGAALSLLQAYTFLIVAQLAGIGLPWQGWASVLPALVAVALMLGAFGLLLSVSIRQLENFAATMNFVIFPLFFISSAIYPLSRLEESRAAVVFWLARANPFTYGVELIRFALYGQFNPIAAGVVIVSAIAFYLAAVIGYDPQRGLIRRAAPPP